jgi:molecular chaperone DnaK
MIKDAGANSESDKKKREFAEVKNHAESAIHSIEKSLKEHGGKLGGADRKTIEQARDAARSELENADATTESLKSKTGALTNAAMKLGEIVYRQAQEQQANGEAGAAGDKTVDAEFEEKKE